MTNKITIDPAVALNELTIDANYSRDRRLFLANELHKCQQEIERLNAIIAEMQDSRVDNGD